MPIIDWLHVSAVLNFNGSFARSSEGLPTTAFIRSLLAFSYFRPRLRRSERPHGDGGARAARSGESDRSCSTQAGPPATAQIRQGRPPKARSFPRRYSPRFQKKERKQHRLKAAWPEICYVFGGGRCVHLMRNVSPVQSQGSDPMSWRPCDVGFAGTSWPLHDPHSVAGFVC